MFLEKQATPMMMVRLGLSTTEERDEYEANKIEINKKITHLDAAAAKNAKQDCCFICKKKCTSFCNSHSVPKFVLQRIACNGKVVSPLQGEVPSMGNNLGVKKAGTFHLICDECDNTAFQQYENPNAYSIQPTDQMLAQIALKDLLLQVSKRFTERELYKLLGEEFPDRSNLTDEKIFIGDYDLRDYLEDLGYAKKSLSERIWNRYYLAYCKVLDYVVPYGAQSSITMISDFEDNIINNIFSFDHKYRMKDIHVAVFPLERTSVVLLFVKHGETRYRKFFRQLNKLSEEDQLAAINYIIFCYTENVFLQPELHQQLKKNEKFMDVCRISTDYVTTTPFVAEDPLTRAIQEFSLTKRLEIPNLLSREYSLREEV